MGGVQRLHHHVHVEVPIPAEKRGAEAAGSQDASRLVAMQWEGGEPLAVQRGGLQNGGQGLVPLLLLQGRPVGVVVGLGLCSSLRGAAGRLREGLLGPAEVARAELELAQAVE